MKAYVEVSGENDDAPCSIYAFFDTERFLFDCGEGTQRFVHGRNGIVLSKVKSIFLTSLSWESIGGLIGFILTHFEGGPTPINIIGPKGLNHIFKSLKEFQWMTNFIITEVENENIYIKETSSNITCIPIIKKTSNTVDQDRLLCYIASTIDIKGKFYPDRAIKLGVPKGKDFTKLNNGESVISATTGQLVNPSDCMDPNTPGSKFLVIRCPSSDYFESLFENSAFTNNQFTGIFHIVSSTVLATPEYQEFIKKLSTPNITKNIIVNNEQCEYYPSFAGSDKQVSQLQSLVPNLFNLSKDERKVLPLPSNLISDQNSLFVQACSKITRIHLAPTNILGKLEISTIVDNEIDNTSGGMDFFTTDNGQAIKKELDSRIDEIERPSMDVDKKIHPMVLFTGTSSAIPSKFRNVTGNYIGLPENRGLLLDAGEGTYGQLFRFFGPEKIKDHLLGIELIWISHIHADHHLGITRILQKQKQFSMRHGVIRPSTIVVAPSPIIRWLEQLSLYSPMEFIGIEMEQQPDELFYQRCSERLGISGLTYVPVEHCSGAYGIVVDFNDGFRLTYSGDTRPCKELVKAGINSSLLIHEATFEDDKLPDAKAKRHSTTGEALTVGKDMNAQFVLLTHFSSRYPRLPTTNSETNNFGLAFDLLSISPYQYPLFQSILKPIDQFFTHELEKKEAERQQLSEKQNIKKLDKKDSNNNTNSTNIDLEALNQDKEQKENERLQKYHKKHKHVKKIYNIIKLTMKPVNFEIIDISQDLNIDNNSSGDSSPLISTINE